MGSISIYTAANNVEFFLLAVFIFVALCSDRKYKWQASVLSIYFLISIILPELNNNLPSYRDDYVNQCIISLMVTGCASLAMIATTFFGVLNKRQSLILIIYVAYHGIVLYRYEFTNLNPIFEVISASFANFFDEAALVVYLSMVGISYNGIRTGFTNVSWRVQRLYSLYNIYLYKVVRIIRKRKELKERDRCI